MAMRISTIGLVGSLLGISGCAESSLEVVREQGDSADTATESTVPEDDGDGSDTDAVEDGPDVAAAYWSLDGELVIVGGQPALESSTFELEAFATDATTVCTLAAKLVLAAETAAPEGDPGLVGWWSVAFADASEDGEDGSCASVLPTELSMGFGPLDERLNSALVAAQWDLATVSGFGLYAQYPSSDPTLYVFGLAGTAPQLAGDEAAPADAPVPDGTYALHSLYLLPLPE